MKKISELLTVQSPRDGFPVMGVNGYGGEWDNSRPVFSGPHRFASRKAADEEFPEGVPDYVQLHWGKYQPGKGWEVVFGWWDYQSAEGDGNPL